MNGLLKNKVCVITGAGKGFGRDLAMTYLSHGAKLALITRSIDDVTSLLNALPIVNAKDCLIVRGDVSDRKVVFSFIQQTIDHFGAIDVLVNNAGMRFRRDFLDITEEEFRLVMNNNFFSMVYLCQAVLPHMSPKRSGKIINISSIAGTLGLSNLSAYVSSKAAIIGLTKSLAVEFAEKNIQINAIAPGFAKTSYFDNFQKNQDLFKYTLDRIPMKRWGESKEIANVCLFLSSELSDYVTGDVINVDGGWSAC
jgi:NAD(P)-dependent dehydrogenase (short-subunit alcohol dehydrogenase family)